MTTLAWTEPSAMFADVASRRGVAWLDAVTGHGYSILAAEPSCIFQARGRHCDVDGDQFEGDPFAVLDELLQKRRVAGGGDFPTGAAIGYFGYGLKNVIEDLPSRAKDDLGLPDCWFGFYDDLLVFDHDRQVTLPVGTAVSAVRDAKTMRRAETARPTGMLESNFTREAYCAAVRRAKEYIAAGDIYQVNLSQRFQCGVECGPVELYHALRAANPAPYGAYLDIGSAQIVSSSPECFLRMRDREIVTRPIKGTLPRHRDPDDLLRSPKDNAELLMITDLERNDLGRVCEFGSVHVPELVTVESYATVHHLVATVAGKLRRDVSHVQAVRACFPGGSITGAPKIRAMEIIDELEPHARGVYCGALGFFGYNGVSHFNIAIRTAVYVDRASSPFVGKDGNSNGLEARSTGGLLTFQAGGGIVADSEPNAEYDETLAKAQGIINALDQLRLRQR